VNIGCNSQPKSLLIFCGVKSRSERLRKVGPKTAGFDGYDFRYKPSGFQPSKMFGFDFETFPTDLTVHGDLQFELSILFDENQLNTPSIRRVVK